ARQRYALRLRVLRSRDSSTRERRKSLRRKSVTHVSGINRYPCVRNGPVVIGSPTRARTWDLRINSPSLYQLSYRGTTCNYSGAVILGQTNECLRRFVPLRSRRHRPHAI